MLTLDDVGFSKVLLLTSLVPSASTHYLGLRLEIFIVPYSLHALMVDFLVDNSRNAPMSPNFHTLQVTWLQLIHSYLSKCTMVPWHSLSSMVSCLVLVNKIHQWLVIQRIFLMFDFDTLIHMTKIVPWVWNAWRLYGFTLCTTGETFWFLLQTKGVGQLLV
jgi:hypothetical protein